MPSILYSSHLHFFSAFIEVRTLSNINFYIDYVMAVTLTKNSKTSCSNATLFWGAKYH